MNLSALSGESARPSWLKRAGTFGCAFFLVKGILWLVFAYFAQSYI